MPPDEPALTEFDRRQRRAGVLSNVATYAFGVALGCVLVGALLWMRQAGRPAASAPAAATPPPATAPNP